MLTWTFKEIIPESETVSAERIKKREGEMKSKRSILLQPVLTEELVQVPTCEKTNESRVSIHNIEIKPVTEVFVQTS